jgi:glycerol-3-phosphate acyltransferase PlsY
VIVSKLCAKEDVRTHGRGNAGMTNMLRTYGKRLAIFTLIGDFGKGVACAIVLIRLLFGWMQFSRPAVRPTYIAGLFVLLSATFIRFFSAFGAARGCSPRWVSFW